MQQDFVLYYMQFSDRMPPEWPSVADRTLRSEWLALVLILEVSTSNLGPQTSCPEIFNDFPQAT
jgi:hypothetical protein